jgi:hypothetical protein
MGSLGCGYKAWSTDVARSAASGTLMARKAWITALQHCKSYGGCERIGDNNEETTFSAN